MLFPALVAYSICASAAATIYKVESGQILKDRRQKRTIQAFLILAGCSFALLAATIWTGYAILTGQGLPFFSASPRTLSDQELGKESLPPVPAPPEMKDMDVSKDEALAINGRVPFVANGLEFVGPFRFAGNPIDRERAVSCLALAAYYEAGDDVVGQGAVAQVVLNRTRHPAFPKTICGVVFQGSERKTGCQFTFTCDGSMSRRKPSPAAWARATGVANAALSGYVFAGVGAATHYHTNWVVPYWSSSLEKIAQVGTHLFFRWPGYYGTRKALSGAYSGGEIIGSDIEQQVASTPMETATGLAGLEAAKTTLLSNPTLSERVEVAGVNAGDLQGNRVRLSNPEEGQFIIQLEKSAYPGTYAVLANKMCQGKQTCQVLGWTDSTRMPTVLPLTAQVMAAASFHYLKDAAHPTGQARWNCSEFKDRSGSQCIRP